MSTRRRKTATVAKLERAKRGQLRLARDQLKQPLDGADHGPVTIEDA
ncbi:hypothetical protein GCM10023191_047010 [Actinoallomurus oryzae]|uniref:Transposase n=1 Tax=Actinoallomurus oryzae TaxID=502180 RepID=A0ABP8Q9K6_9ACTN